MKMATGVFRTKPSAPCGKKLYPMLECLGIERGGLHAFRHANSTLMDRLDVPLRVRQQRLGTAIRR
jgi:hypothetical protein